MNCIGKLLLLFFALQTTCFAQQIEVKGKVFDKTSQKPIIGVSVQLGRNGTITKSNGEFILSVYKREDSIAKNIVFSCLGYKTKRVVYTLQQYYNIELDTLEENLMDVVVTPIAEQIIIKAIDKIPKNYPTHDFMMKGILRTYQTINDSINWYRYFHEDAVLNIYYPSYLKSNTPQVTVLQNKYGLMQPSKIPFDTNRYVNGPLIVPKNDFVHNRMAFITKSKIKEFRYKLTDTALINNKVVYEIQFSLKRKKEIQGTLYIDTSTLAFVGIDYTDYDLKRFGYVPIKKKQTFILYKQIADTWYLDQINENLTYDKGKLNSFRSFDFNSIGIDTVNVAQLAYKDVIQERDEDIKTVKPGNDSSWVYYDSLFNKAEHLGIISNILMPDFSKNEPLKKASILSTVLNYLRNDNYRQYVFLSKLPDITGNLLDYTNRLTTYSIGIGTQTRIYKNLFFLFEGTSNLGLGNIKNSATTYGLCNNLLFNKKKRLITISPAIGYYTLNIKNNAEGKNAEFKSFIAGFTTALEIKHNRSFFVSVSHYFNSTTSNVLYSITPNNIGVSIGIIRKM